MRNKLNTLLLCTLFVSILHAQGKKDMAISFSGGLMNSPYYEKADAKVFYKAGFDYHLSSRQVLSVEYLSGKHDYFDNVLSNDPSAMLKPNGTNSEASYQTFSVSYKYKVVNLRDLFIAPSIGAGI